MTLPFPNHDLEASCSPPYLTGNSTADRSDMLRRLAALVALGDVPLPEDLAPDELRTILTEVARLRRDRLVGFIARAIASDIESAGEL